jgi:hypothetical protein
MHGDVAANNWFIERGDGAVIEQIAHMPATAEKREADLADIGAVAGEAINDGAVSTTAHDRLGTELTPDAAIHTISDQNLAGGKSVDGVEKQLVLAAGLRRVCQWARRQGTGNAKETHTRAECLDVGSHGMMMQAASV